MRLRFVPVVIAVSILICLGIALRVGMLFYWGLTEEDGYTRNSLRFRHTPPPETLCYAPVLQAVDEPLFYAPGHGPETAYLMSYQSRASKEEILASMEAYLPRVGWELDSKMTAQYKENIYHQGQWGTLWLDVDEIPGGAEVDMTLILSD